jgi:hypothetical protein
VTKSDGHGEISRRALLQAATALAVVPAIACGDTNRASADRNTGDAGTETKASCATSATQEPATSNGTTMPDEPGASSGSNKKLFFTTVPVIISSTLHDAALALTNFDLDDAGLRQAIGSRFGDDRGSMGDGKFGAVHGLDVSASFNNARDSTMSTGAAAGKRIATKFSTTWATFAKTGNPNNSEIPDWSPYDADKRAIMIFDEEPRVVNDYRGELIRQVAPTT